MRSIFLLISLLLSITAFGQPSPINRRAMVLAGLAQAPKGPDGALDLVSTGMYLRWKSADVLVGATVSNQWADRIQGLLAQQGDPAKQPTNALKGVYFNGSTWLTNVQINLANQAVNNSGLFLSYAVLLIIEQDSTSGSQTFLWDNTISGAYGILTAAGPTMYWGHFNNVYRPLNYSRVNNYVNDVLLCPTNGYTHVNFYTNGISTGVDINQNETSSFILQGIGADSNGSAGRMHGYVSEIIVWTNGVPNSYSFSSGDISNIHYYSTNVYPITP